MSDYETKFQCYEVDSHLSVPKRKLRGVKKQLFSGWIIVSFLAGVVVALQAPQVLAQAAPTPTPTPIANPCPSVMLGQNLVPVPEIVTKDGKLRGTLVLGDEQEWVAFRVPISAPSDTSRSQCVPQFVRTFREYGAPTTTASAPSGPYSNGSYALPRPGPTLRARVGDLVQLTFLNQINPSDFGNSIDRGETGEGGGCDESSSGYPGSDKFPDCFHGSSTGNIHFHGTHTNPGSTGDNVFIEIRPSPRVNNAPVVTLESVQRPFSAFFDKCEMKLSKNVLEEWPRTWSDLPNYWTDEQRKLLRQYDTKLEKDYPNNGVRKLLPVDEAQLKQGAWPQYYIGAYPYCFRLPEYTATTWPPSKPATMNMGGGMAEMSEGDRALIMGQSPGTHWYHAHKHGSTAINVANGMTGAFIIEGQYDDDLNKWYGDGWTRTQSVMVINQLGVSPNLMRGGNAHIDKGPDFSINGQLKPVIQMQPGEVQMWRIVNTSGRAGAFFVGPPKGFEWKQLAQDGVQFNDANYQRSHNNSFLMAAGNRVDLLVKAPSAPCAVKGGCAYPVLVQNEVDPSDLATADKITMMTLNVSGDPVDPKSNGANFIPNAPTFPVFLGDISSSDVTGTKTIEFASTSPGKGANHTIDGKKFDGEVGAVVLLNKVEEWKIVNKTYGPPISHPFHIHINPFQIVEVFDPNEILTDKNGNPIVDPISKKPVNKYIFQGGIRLMPGQCYLNPFGNPDDWKPCGPAPVNKNGIWWDVFPIPSGRVVTTAKIDPTTKKPVTVNVPGYFKMRSRFVDYTGFYVIHCHILAHEDRGMMTIVEVAPATTPYAHQ